MGWTVGRAAGDGVIGRSRVNPQSTVRIAGFTLIELLVVISIIIILGALAFPVISGVLDRAKKTQAKNDMVQVATAVNAFYTEYGRYPVTANSGADGSDFFAADNNENNVLMDILRAEPRNGTAMTNNPRMVVFFQPRIAKDLSKPSSGIGGNGRLYDPWNNCYRIRVDSNYNSIVENPYSAGAGFPDVGAGVIVWSIGKDKAGATDKKNGGTKDAGTSKDDVISWQ